MKKFSFVLAFFALSFGFAQAQTSSGTIFLGGDLGFESSNNKFHTSSTTTQGDKTSKFGINLNGGYFVADKLAVGLGIGYNMNKLTETVGTLESKTTGNTFAVMPFARYYFMLGENFGFTGTLSVGYGMGNSKTEFSSTTTTTAKFNTLEVGITPGIVFFPIPSIGLEASAGFLGYNNYRSIDPNNSDNYSNTSTIGLGVNTLNPTFNFGLHYYFGAGE